MGGGVMRCLIKCFLCILVILLFHCQLTFCYSSSSNFFPSGSNSSSSLPPQLCSREESYALLNFKNNFSINSTASKYCAESYPTTNSWKESTDCCTWDGVTCDRWKGHVIGLDLMCSWIFGSFHSNNSLFRLPHLRRLNLAGNHFNYSQIPSQFGTSLTGLTYLNLAYSKFSGQFPTQLSHLSKLVSLDLSQEDYGNGMYMDLPLQPIVAAELRKQNFKRLVQNLTDLRELALNSVDMSSVDLGSLRNLSSSLKYLGLSGCKLQGRLPDHIFRLPNLQFLDLSYNSNLTGYFSKNNWTSPLRGLELSDTSFSGKLPDSIGNLKSLYYLGLAKSWNFRVQTKCYFYGPLPASLGNLTQIIYLSLSGNQFIGEIPLSISNLVLLQLLLDLSSNNLSGQFPPSILNLTQIQSLSLSGNQFVGSVPSSISKLVRLQWLRLSFNNLTGELPSSILNLTQIQELALSGNQFVGSIPSGVIWPPNLISLYFHYNQLSGTIPSWLYRLKYMETLRLHNNKLTGRIEEFQCRTLVYIDLSNNELQGPIPRSIFEQANLTNLYLSFNNLSGSLDEYVLPTLANIHRIDLSNNHIGGLIPKWLLNNGERLQYVNLSHNILEGFYSPILPWAYTIDLQSNRLHGSLPIPSLDTMFYSVANNKLSGELPPLICESSSLVVLDLSNNDFSGLLPCLGNVSYFLKVLNLRRNRFHGPIPLTFAQGSMLRSLDVSDNKLQGLVPRSLVHCKELEVLNLGNNDIHDTFPFWLEILPKLQVLVLRTNRFYGPILLPKRKSAFSNLNIIDLSYNNFTGVMPSKFFKTLRSTAMMNDSNSERKYMKEQNYYYFDSVTVETKGRELEFVRILTIFRAIDFSNNNFEGEIPNSIGNLKSVRVLDFSSNSLRGPIPSSLGNLNVIESLDLSNNNLSGEIPMQLMSLTSLSFFDVSQNHLEGPIPQGSQFNTFSNNSYKGNSGLCGFPLTKKCERGEKARPPPLKAEESQSSSKFTMDIYEWIVVLMGYGCGLVIGVVGGNYIMQRKKEWFMKTFGIWQHRPGRRLNRKRQNGTRGR